MFLKGGESNLSLSAICMASSLEWAPLLKPLTSCSSSPSSSRMASLFTPLLLARTSGVDPLWLLFKCKSTIEKLYIESDKNLALLP